MPKRNLIWLAAILVAALVTLIVTSMPPHGISTVRVEFDPVTEAYRTIRERYLYPVEGNLVRRSAIEGMVSQLDEYSTYVPPARAEAFADRMAGLAWGTGLRVEATGKEVVVIGAMQNSPARGCGLLGGERILQIDGNDVSGLPQAAVEALVDAPPASPALLTVLRPDGRKEPNSCPRGKFALETVQGLSRGSTGEWNYLLPGNSGLAYVRIREIIPTPPADRKGTPADRKGTPAHLRETLPQLGSLRAILLDLRDNPGGDFGAAVELANIFLRDGLIVSVVSRAGQVDHPVIPDLRAVGDDVRVVVLVNERTASGAEMIAAALACRDRAVLVGQRTAGKGCIQSMILLGGGLGRLNLTTGEFFVDPLRPIQRFREANARGAEGCAGRFTLPGHVRRDPNVWGVDPHVPEPVPADLEANLALWRTRAEVVRQLRPGAANGQEEDPGAVLLQRDPQLKRAVELASNPDKMDDELRRAAEARAKARDQPITPPPAPPTRPDAAGGAPPHE